MRLAFGSCWASCVPHSRICSTDSGVKSRTQARTEDADRVLLCRAVVSESTLGRIVNLHPALAAAVFTTGAKKISRPNKSRMGCDSVAETDAQELSGIIITYPAEVKMRLNRSGQLSPLVLKGKLLFCQRSNNSSVLPQAARITLGRAVSVLE